MAKLLDQENEADVTCARCDLLVRSSSVIP